MHLQRLGILQQMRNRRFVWVFGASGLLGVMVAVGVRSTSAPSSVGFLCSRPAISSMTYRGADGKPVSRVWYELTGSDAQLLIRLISKDAASGALTPTTKRQPIAWSNSLSRPFAECEFEFQSRELSSPNSKVIVQLMQRKPVPVLDRVKGWFGLA